ncbi:MAG: hypothetical protein ACK40G_04140 [Cytophagaceae bacterium]
MKFLNFIAALSLTLAPISIYAQWNIPSGSGTTNHLTHIGTIDYDLKFTTNWTTRMMIAKNTGYIGIGFFPDWAYTSPSARLEVRQHESSPSRNVLLKLSNDYNSSEGRLNEPTLLFDNGSPHGTFGSVGWSIGAQVSHSSAADGRFRISRYTGNPAVFQDYLTILENGKVLIGMNPPHINHGPCLAPDARLAVNGTIYATSIKVRTVQNGCFPDYVFSSDYKLRTLDEVEKFIKVNSHLPEVPSAKDVEENGINLAEMDEILLKKIEELTLYLIELKKENAQIKLQLLELQQSK